MVFGLHGHAITLGIVAPIWFAMDAQQLAAYAAGVDLPNITGFAFFMTYGAAGDLLPLAIMLAFFAKSARYKTLGKIALPPAIFTIGEPMAYGVPLVMNFTLAIPYIFINGIMLGIAWYLTVIGVLPRVAGVSTPAGMPIIISGFMQGSWKIAAFQFIGLLRDLQDGISSSRLPILSLVGKKIRRIPFECSLKNASNANLAMVGKMLSINYQTENIIVDHLPIMVCWSTNYPQKSFTIKVYKGAELVSLIAREGNKTIVTLDAISLQSFTSYTIEVLTHGDNGENNVFKNSFTTSNLGHFLAAG